MNFYRMEFSALVHSVMPRVSGSAWKVICLIWNRQEKCTYDEISKGTGLSVVTVKEALQELKEFSESGD